MRGLSKVPKCLALHRQAAIALYRALLQQCEKVPLDSSSRVSLANIVRNRFRCPRRQRLRLALAFHSGYTALNLLDASVNGDATSTARIADLLARVPSYLTGCSERRRETDRSVLSKPDPSVLDPPAQHKFLARFPRAKVEGVRRVPTLVNANGWPFVRYKRRQPENVSRMLRRLQATARKRYKNLEYLRKEALPLAYYEDHWDAQVGLYDDNADFVTSVLELKKQAESKILSMENKREGMILRMTEIVLKERELAEKERQAKSRQ